MFLSNKNLQHIIAEEKLTGTRVSIYIPTHPASTGPTLSEDVIRFKNALKNIKTHDGYNEQELGSTLKKLELIPEDSEFWKNRTMGLAIFADKDGYEIIDLNYEVSDMQYLQDAYVASPLALMLSVGTGYYVLDVNHTKSRLVHFTSHSMNEVAGSSMPGSFDETVERDESQNELQHQGVTGNKFHGHDKSAALDADTLRYYKLIAKVVDNYLIDHDEPLLLTGTENRIGHMRALLNYHHVIQEAIEGNSEELNEQQLQNATAAVIERVEIKHRGELIEKAKSAPPTKLAYGYEEIESAIASGRVETLYLSAFRRTADNVRDGNRPTVVLQLPKDIMKIEQLIRGVFSLSGNVVAVEQGSFDNDEPLALCRF